MDWFERTLDRLRRHFRRVDAESPASTRGLQLLVSEIPSAPEDLVSFFRRSDGVDVHLDDDVVGHLYSLEEARSAYPVALDGEIASRLLPIRADGCGNYDCLVVGLGIAQGAVVFWDHEVYEGPSHLLAGSFASYFEMWGDHVIQVYLPDGREDPRYVAPSLTEWPWIGDAEKSHPWPYDEERMKERDPRAASLLCDPQTRTWLLRQNE